MFGYRSTANASRDVLLLLVLCALSPVVYANGESMFCLHGEDAGDAATPGPEDPNTYSAHVRFFLICFACATSDNNAVTFLRHTRTRSLKNSIIFSVTEYSNG